VKIDGFQGLDHEFDFLKLVFSSAPMIRRVIVKLSDEHSSGSEVCEQIYDLFRAYSSVECRVYLYTGERIHDEGYYYF
jgi:hypothetical protein